MTEGALSDAALAPHRQHADEEAESLAEQLGNVGTEVSRASWWHSRNPETARLALHRTVYLVNHGGHVKLTKP